MVALLAVRGEDSHTGCPCQELPVGHLGVYLGIFALASCPVAFPVEGDSPPEARSEDPEDDVFHPV